MSNTSTDTCEIKVVNPGIDWPVSGETFSESQIFAFDIDVPTRPTKPLHVPFWARIQCVLSGAKTGWHIHRAMESDWFTSVQWTLKMAWSEFRFPFPNVAYPEDDDL